MNITASPLPNNCSQNFKTAHPSFPQLVRPDKRYSDCSREQKQRIIELLPEQGVERDRENWHH
jgi:hypothetical protein